MDTLGGDTEALGFDMPTMMNQPQQVFGRYNSDGSPVPPAASISGYQDDPTGDEVNDAKRRRIARACDMCRKKKIKCDGKMPKCSHCINYKTECIFTTVEKKRNPPKGAKYIEGLENRLGRMEALLRLSGLLSEEDAGKTDLGTLEKRLADRSEMASRNQRMSSSTNAHSQSAHSTPRIDSPQTSVESPESQKGTQNEIEELSDLMCSLVTNNSGETRYIGSSSGFSIFSPVGIKWVNRKTGDTSFQDMLAAAAVDDNRWLYWKPEIFSDIFARRVFRPLPPKEEAFSLFKDYFDNFNHLFPLFHAPTFMHLAEREYSKDPYEGSGWWASLNVVLAIAHRLRVMSNLVPQEEDKKAWLYLKNAMAVLTELTMRNTDLLSVQALLGMCLFLQGTPNPQPAFCLVAAAIRLSHSIGLHKRGSAFGLNVVEAEQRKRVFWIAYLMDKDICLRSGRPPMQDDDDMNVELPSESPLDDIGNIRLSDGKGQVNLFRVMCRFAIIQSKVYKRLYSTKAAKQSDGELLNTIGELDKELEDWKETIPVEYRPDSEIKASHTPLVIPLVVLHFSYFNCLITIHRMSVHHGYWTSRLSNYALQGLNARPLNPRVFSSATLCVVAARASINLIKYIPQGDFACVWLIMYYPVSALVTLFANILQNPQDTRARSDIKLMDLVVNFLSNMVSEETKSIWNVTRMLHVCSEFERMAKVVIDKAEKESHSRRKRKVATENTGLDSQRDLPDRLPPSPASIPPQPDARQTSIPFSPLVSEPSDGNMFSPTVDGLASVSDSTLPVSSGEDSTVNLERMPEFGYDFHNVLSPTALDQAIFDNQQPYLNNGAAMSNPSFQQSFVPQDLWQMPMTIEWDWANSAFPSLENEELFGDPMRNGQYS